jgi:hypothetical protein
LLNSIFEHPAGKFIRWAHRETIEADTSLDRLCGNIGSGLPGPEWTTIEMDKLRAWIKPYPTIPEFQCGMPNLTKLDTWHIEINRLPLNMQTVLRDSSAPL